MNKKPLLIKTLIAAAGLFVGILAGKHLFSGNGQASGETAAAGAADAVEESTTWTCSMHPQIQQPEEGDCPICGMDLIPLEADSGDDEGPRTLSMSESSRALADIQTSPVLREFPEAKVRLVGKLAYDETKVRSLTARFPARIDELFVNFTGIRVNRGEHLAEVYSPDLFTAQRELLTAYRSDPDSSITRAAREKLRLWDLLPDQIEAIIERNEARDNFVLRAPIGGVVVRKQVKEGDYIKTGQPLFVIVDLSELWLFLDAYESDLAWLRYGQDVAFEVEAFPGETFHGTISFIEPEVDRKTRTVPIRVTVPNEDRRLKPGMFARGVVDVRLAEGGKVYAPELTGKWISPMHPEVVKDVPGQCDVCGMDLVPAESLGYVDDEEEEMPLIVPASAVLRTGRRAVVYVEKPDADRPAYEGREIVLGPRAGDVFIVKEGLDEGMRVVTNGAFKIDSALQIQAKPSMMNPVEDKGQGTRDKGRGTRDKGLGSDEIDLSTAVASRILEPYLAMQSALADDNFEAAREQARALMEVSGHSGALAELVHEMLAAEDIEAFRKPLFEDLSNSLIAAVREDPDAFDGELLLMHCPMVYPDRGADWLQRSEPLLNPYYGDMMLYCGEVKEHLTAD